MEPANATIQSHEKSKKQQYKARKIMIWSREIQQYRAKKYDNIKLVKSNDMKPKKNNTKFTKSDITKSENATIQGRQKVIIWSQQI